MLWKKMGCYAPQAFKLWCMNTWNKQCIKNNNSKKNHMDSLEQGNCN